MSEQMPVNVPQEVPKILETINERVDIRADRADLERQQASVPTLMTEKTKQFNALEDVTAHLEEDSDAAAAKLVPEKDIHGPLVGHETLKAETVESKAPTVRSEKTMELDASKAQTFKMGKTIESEDAAKETLRNLEQDYMEYGALHKRVTDWLKIMDAMSTAESNLPEFAGLRQEILQAKEAVEKQLDVEQFGIANKEAGATPFKVEVPKNWYQTEARLNEIMESMKAGKTIRPAMGQEQTLKIDKAA